MWKKILASILIGISLFSFSTFGYSSNVVDTTKYAIINPEKLSYSSPDKVILINGKAPSGTEIIIDVYGSTDITSTRKNFHLDNLPNEKDYILTVTDKVISGNMGLFQKKLDLVKGINKLVIDFGVEGVEPVEIIVYVYDRARTSTRQARLTSILPKPLLK